MTTNALTGLSSLQNCAAPPGLVLCAFGSRYLQQNYEPSTESFLAIWDSVCPSAEAFYGGRSGCATADLDRFRFLCLAIEVCRGALWCKIREGWSREDS